MTHEYSDPLIVVCDDISKKLDEVIKLLTLSLTINNEETLEKLRNDLLEGTNNVDSHDIEK